MFYINFIALIRKTANKKEEVHKKRKLRKVVEMNIFCRSIAAKVSSGMA